MQQIDQMDTSRTRLDQQLRAITDQIAHVSGELDALRRTRDVLADARLEVLHRDGEDGGELRGLRRADRLVARRIRGAYQRQRHLFAQWTYVFGERFPDSPIGKPKPQPATRLRGAVL